MSETIERSEKKAHHVAAKVSLAAVYDVIKIVVAIIAALSTAAVIRIFPWPTRQEVSIETAAIRAENKATYETKEHAEFNFKMIQQSQEYLQEGVGEIKESIKSQDETLKSILRHSRRGNED